MDKKAPEATFVADTTPNDADEVTSDKLTTAPQEQLDRLHSVKHPNSLRATSKLKA